MILLDKKMCDKKQDGILEDAFSKTAGACSVFLYRQADKNGDGKLALDEIISIFKVSPPACHLVPWRLSSSTSRQMTSPAPLRR